MLLIKSPKRTQTSYDNYTKGDLVLVTLELVNYPRTNMGTVEVGIHYTMIITYHIIQKYKGAERVNGELLSFCHHSQKKLFTQATSFLH